jgi:MSHA biogenesis protein MshJ
MKQRFAKMAESIDRLSLRERLFLFAAGLFIVGGLWEALLAAPLAARERQANEKVAALQERLLKLDASVETAATGMSEGVPGQLDQLRALRERVTAGEEEMRIFTTDLVDPAEMRLVLEELLRRQTGLVLVSAINKPARPVIEELEPESDSAATEDEESRSDAPRLYRHSLVLTLRGSYLDCLDYLRAVERLPWHIYWSRLQFAIDDYPTNDIVLELTTLSLDEEWIGV